MPSTIGYPQRLTSKISLAKKDELDRVEGLLRWAEEARRDREKQWEMNERAYNGETWAGLDDPTADIVNSNLVFSTIQTINPFITGGNSAFIVEPYSGDSNKVNARYQEVYLNRYWRSSRLNGKEAIENSSFDYLIYGDGFPLVTWDLKQHYRYDELGKQIPGSEYDIVEFDIKSISPWDVYLDPSARGLSDARWAFVRSTVALEVLKKDKRFYNTKFIEAGQTELYRGHDGRVLQASASIQDNHAEDYVVIYDFYDIENRRLITIARGMDVPLRWIEQIQCPLVQIGNHPIPNSPWHMSEVEQILSLQDELNKTRSQMITHRRRNVAKVLYRSSRLDEEAIDALQSSAVLQAVPIEGDEPFADIVQVMAAEPINSELYAVSDVIRGDIFEITGVNEYLRGSIPSDARTATEASIIEGGSNVKIKHKLAQIENATRRVGQLILDIASEAYAASDFVEMSLYLTGEDAQSVLRATGNDVYSEEGVPMDAGLTPTPQIFAGEYEVFVERGSTELRSPRFNEQKFKEMFLVLVQTAPILAQMGVPLNVKKALELWLESAGVTDIEAIFGQEGMQNMQSLLAQQQLQQAPPSEQTIEGANQQPGEPNAFGLGAPQAPITEENSGILPPQL